MKKINSLIMILLTFAAFNVSAQVDVGVSAIRTPASGDTVYAGIPKAIGFTITNYGSALTSEVIQLVLEIDGDSIVTLNRPASALAAGGTQNLGTPGINFGATALALTDGIHNVCLRTLFAADGNAMNDTSCVSIYYSSTLPPADLAVTAVSVTDPTPVGIGFELGQSQLQVVTFTLKNVGSTAIQAGTRVAVELTVGSASNTLSLTLSRAIAAGASINATASRASIAALVDFPTTVGNFDVCMAASYTGDVNTSNDTSCATYTITPRVTPNIVSFSPITAKCGETVTITGTNFDPTPANNIVRFRSDPAKVLTASATQLTVVVPDDAQSGFMTVEIKVNGVAKIGTANVGFIADACNVSVDEINNEFGKVYYANNSLNIVANNASKGVKQVQIMNMAGQIIFDEVRDLQSNNVETIDLSSAPNGVYVVNIEGHTTSFAK